MWQSLWDIPKDNGTTRLTISSMVFEFAKTSGDTYVFQPVSLFSTIPPPRLIKFSNLQGLVRISFFLCFCVWFWLLGRRPCVPREKLLHVGSHVFQKQTIHCCDTCARRLTRALRGVKNSTLLKAYNRSVRAKEVRLGYRGSDFVCLRANRGGGALIGTSQTQLSQRSLVDCLPRFFYSRQAGDWHRTINTPNFQSSRHWRVGDR